MITDLMNIDDFKFISLKKQKKENHEFNEPIAFRSIPARLDNDDGNDDDDNGFCLSEMMKLKL